MAEIAPSLMGNEIEPTPMNVIKEGVFCPIKLRHTRGLLAVA